MRSDKFYQIIRFEQLAVCVILWLLLPSHPALAVCATVKIEIVQEVTLERQAFDARLQVFNETDKPIENLLVTVTYADEAGLDKAALFYTSFTSATGMSGKPDGSGRIEAKSTGDLHWLIIPSPGAGGQRPEGVPYLVGATLSFQYNGELHTEVMNPDFITVQPMPLLTLDYFLTRDVIGDDPYTVETEPPIPFALGVRISNNGYGPANNLKIESGQPEIVDNDQGLLIAFTIIGSEVNGVPGTTDLLVDFGNLEPTQAGVARWNLIATLSGQFISFDASFTHSDALGGELTSLIEEVNAHFLMQEVLVDTNGRDSRKDFLAISEDGTGLHVYESDNVDRGVHDERNTSGVAGSLTPSTPTVRVTCNPHGDPFYAFVPDPGQGRFKLLSATRADGKVLRPENFQLIPDYDLDSHSVQYYLGIFDSSGLCDYSVTYQVSSNTDVTAPSMQVRVLDPYAQVDTGLCVRSSTQFLFTATDTQSTVKGMYMQLDGDAQNRSAYDPAISPFRFELRPALGQGAHKIHYYASDAANNLETPHSLAVILDDQPPTLSQALTVSPVSFAPSAAPGSGSATEVAFGLTPQDACGPLEVVLEGSSGTSFNSSAIVATLKAQTYPGQPVVVRWNGKGSSGATLPASHYAFRARVKDALGQEYSGGNVVVQLVDALSSLPLSSVPGADQLNPVTDGTHVIWQDNRSDDWDIYLYTFGQGETLLSSSAPTGTDQTSPWVEGEWATWLDARNGTPRVVVYHLPTHEEAFISLAGRHSAPHLQNGLLVFDAELDGQHDVYAFDLLTSQLSRLTTHERDQRNPVTNGTWVVYEDYRDGAKPELYGIDLAAETPEEVRLTVQLQSAQQQAALADDTLLWLDDRHGDWDVYQLTLSTGEERRLTYRRGDQQALATDGTLWVGLEKDATLLFGTLEAGVARRLSTADVERQHPSINQNVLVWSELSDDYWQLRFGDEERPALTLPVRPGFNLLALPSELMPTPTQASVLLLDWNTRYGVTQLGQLTPSGTVKQVVWTDSGITGTDFTLNADHALLLEGSRDATIPINALSRSSGVGLIQGVQGLGVASIPYGYGVQELLAAVDPADLAWIRRVDANSSHFEAMTLESGLEGGERFEWDAGEGVLVFVNSPVTLWRP